MEKETVQEIIKTLKTHRDHTLSEYEKRAPGDTWKDYYLGCGMGFEVSMNLIKEYLDGIEKGGEI